VESEQESRTIHRVLIEWDYGAQGIWILPELVISNGVVSSLRCGHPLNLADLLSTSLLESLQEWNDLGEQVYGGPRNLSAPEKVQPYRAAGRALAVQTQEELGDEWDVWFSSEVGGYWAWTVLRWNKLLALLSV
jgi:hypothetical protein